MNIWELSCHKWLIPGVHFMVGHYSTLWMFLHIPCSIGLSASDVKLKFSDKSDDLLESLDMPLTNGYEKHISMKTRKWMVIMMLHFYQQQNFKHLTQNLQTYWRINYGYYIAAPIPNNLLSAALHCFVFYWRLTLLLLCEPVCYSFVWCKINRQILDTLYFPTLSLYS